MLRKMLTTVLFTSGLVLVGGVATAAPPYEAPGGASVGVNDADGIIPLGQEVLFFGSGFTPGETINVTEDFSPGNALRSSRAMRLSVKADSYTDTADESGAFSYDVVNDQQIGTTNLTATGASSGLGGSVTITMVGAGSDGAGTGSGDSGSTTTVAAAGTGGSDNGTGLAYTGRGADGNAGGGLAYTGTSVAGPIAIGAAALLAGLTLLFFGTRGVIRRKGSGTARS